MQVVSCEWCSVFLTTTSRFTNFEVEGPQPAHMRICRSCTTSRSDYVADVRQQRLLNLWSMHGKVVAGQLATRSQLMSMP